MANLMAWEHAEGLLEPRQFLMTSQTSLALFVCAESISEFRSHSKKDNAVTPLPPKSLLRVISVEAEVVRTRRRLDGMFVAFCVV